MSVVITGGDDAELAQDGRFLAKDERYAPTSAPVRKVEAAEPAAPRP